MALQPLIYYFKTSGANVEMDKQSRERRAKLLLVWVSVCAVCAFVRVTQHHQQVNQQSQFTKVISKILFSEMVRNETECEWKMLFAAASANAYQMVFVKIKRYMPHAKWCFVKKIVAHHQRWR